MTDLTDKLADALEALSAKWRSEGSMSENQDVPEYKEHADEIDAILALHRAQRDGESGYRMLTFGEVIQNGDEALDAGQWRPTYCVGQVVGHTETITGTTAQYRRPLAKGEA